VSHHSLRRGKEGKKRRGEKGGKKPVPYHPALVYFKDGRGFSTHCAPQKKGGKKKGEGGKKNTGSRNHAALVQETSRKGKLGGRGFLLSSQEGGKKKKKGRGGPKRSNATSPSTLPEAQSFSFLERGGGGKRKGKKRVSRSVLLNFVPVSGRGREKEPPP